MVLVHYFVLPWNHRHLRTRCSLLMPLLALKGISNPGDDPITLPRDKASNIVASELKTR